MLVVWGFLQDADSGVDGLDQTHVAGQQRQRARVCRQDQVFLPESSLKTDFGPPNAPIQNTPGQV